MKKMALVLLALSMVFIAGVCLGQPKGDLVVCQGAEVNALDPAKHNSIPDTNFGSFVKKLKWLR